MESEYDMYGPSDSINSQLLSEEWIAVTFDELSGDYKDDFLSYYNSNGCLKELLTWSSGNCCFSFPESDHVSLTMNIGTRMHCHVNPEIGGNIVCNIDKEQYIHGM